MGDPRTNFQIVKPNDRSILEFFEKIREEYSFPEPSIYFMGMNRSFRAHEQPELLETVKKNKSKTIFQAAISKPGISITFERGIYVPNAHGTFSKTDSLTYDTVKIDADLNQGISPIEVAEITRIAQKHFIKDGHNFSASNDDAIRSAISSHHEIVASLEQTLADVGEKFTEKRLELEQEFDERRHKLHQEIDAARAKADEELAAEKGKLAEAAARLDEQKKALDDRQNTHVRRDLRQQLKGQFTDYRKAFELTKGTRGLRTPIHIVSVALILILISGAAYLATRDAPSDTWLYVIFLLKPIGLTFLTVVLSTWYINWMNRWFERHADAEFRLKELELDIDRASWVVETAFEWKETRDNALPDKLLEAISRNLFTSKEEPERSELNPADHLASALLGQAAKAKLNVGGNEIEFERAALRRAGREN